jgi:hypothetical protein
VIKEYKDQVELYGVVFEDAATKTVGQQKPFEVANAKIVVDSYQKDGKTKPVIENVSGKFATLKLVKPLKKDDIVHITGVRRHREYEKNGEKKQISEIEAHWVDVWGGRPALENELTSEPPLPDEPPMTQQEIDEDMPF